MGDPVSHPDPKMPVLLAELAELRSQLTQLSRAKEAQRRLYQRTPTMLHSINAQGQVVEVNDRWLKVMGYERREVLGRSILEFMDPEHRRRAEKDYLPRFLREGWIEGVPGQMVTKDGRVLETLVSAISDRDEQGDLRTSLTVTRVVNDQKRAEEALKASEARFRNIVETALEGVWEVDADGVTTMVNQRLAEMLGYTQDQMLGRPFYEFVPEHEEPKARRLFEQQRQGFQGHQEFRFITHHGQDKWVMAACTPYLSEEGSFLGGVALVTDISELKQKERELRRERDRAQQYLDTAQVILLALDQRGRVELINQAGCAILGYSSEELKGRDWFETCLPLERREEVRRIFAEIVAGEYEPHTGMENLVLCRDGSSRVVRWHNGVMRDDAGRIVGTFSSGEDVTAQRRAQKELAASENRFRELVENIKEAFWVRDPNTGELLYLSPAVEEVFGLSRQFLYDNPFGLLEMVLPEDRPIMERALADQRVRGADTDVEYRIQRGDGRVRWLRARTVCEAEGQGGVPKVLGVAEDITERKQAQLALAKSQEKFALVFRHSPLWVTISTLEEGIYLDVNETFSEITGFSRQEVLGRTAVEVGVWAEPRQREKAISQIRQRGSLKDFEIDYVTREGQVRHALWSAEAVMLDGRECMISVLRDITRRKLAEKALRQANATLELAQNMAHLGHWSMDIGSRWPVWSDQMYQLTGRERDKGPPEWDEMLGMVHQEDRGEFEAAVESIAASGQPRQVEVRLMRPEGSQRHLTVNAHALRDDQGRVVRLFGIVQDITERKRSEQALRASEEQFRRLFEDTALGVFQSTMEGLIIRVNPAFARMFGYDTPAALLEATQRRAVACYADPEQRKEMLARVLENGEQARLETLYRRRDGSTFNGLQHLRLVRDQQGKPQRLEGFVEDVSRLEEAQKARRALERQLSHAHKMEAVGTLAGGIAHDFNNLLSTIMGYSELAMADLDPAHPSQESLRQVLASSQRARDLVRQLLSFSRAAKGNHVAVDLSALVAESLRLLAPALPENLSLRHDIAEGLATQADSRRIHQAMAVLVNNAQQAIDGREGIVAVSLEQVELEPHETPAEIVPGVYARLGVTDNGGGMSPEVRERAFEPFFTTREVGQGHGMGLAVVHGIVADHQGAVKLESVLGQGTTVTIFLPLLPSEEEPEEA